MTPDTRGPCAKRKVECIIYQPTNCKLYVGENWCRNPQTTCPREEGEGYEKCKTICGQDNHAEEDAIRVAGDDCVGAQAYLCGNSYYCRDCQEALYAAGVEALHLGSGGRLK